VPEQPVLIIKEGYMATVIINRKDVMNALNIETMKLLLSAFKQLASDEAVRVITLEGEGADFSVGADMTLLNEAIATSQWYFFLKNVASDLILTMRTMPKPLICKVRGNAYGFGVGLALAGDFVVASEDARFCEVFVNLGVTLDGGSSYFLPRLIGMVKARELALLGNVIDGKTAATVGLIYRAVPEKSLDGEVTALAQLLAEKSPQALASTKEALEGSFTRSLEAALEWEASHQAILLDSKEHKEAVRRFLNARKIPPEVKR
jgi:2-(1,2-epoxy-1,2-dihydrophenyl)acetyl-CoA isomerase